MRCIVSICIYVGEIMFQATDIMIGKRFGGIPSDKRTFVAVIHPSLEKRVERDTEIINLADLDGKIIKVTHEGFGFYCQIDSKIPKENNPNYPYFTCKEIGQYDAEMHGDVILEVEI